jgi:uncharacterized protein (TIGR02147 family)
MATTRLSVFDYLEYRDFLRDFYKESRKGQSFFSYRYMAAKTGLDPSSVVKILQKQLHLSIKSLPKVIEFLKLNKQESDYFTILVHFNRARDPDQSRLNFEKLLKCRRHPAKVLKSHEYEFFTKWHYAAIKDLLSFYTFDGNYKKLASQLNPPITEREARRAIDLLLELGLIRTTGDGFELTEKNISTGDAWRSIAIRNFQKQLMQLGQEALDTVLPEKRDVSSLSFSISRKELATMRERIRELRHDLVRIANGCSDPDGVYQLNIQLFPLTTLEGEQS